MIGNLTPANKITVFFFEPETWHGHLVCLVQRALGFKAPYSHVVVAVGTNISDFTTDGILTYAGEAVFNEYFKQASDVLSYEADLDDVITVEFFINELKENDFNIRWFDYIIPTLRYVIKFPWEWLPISCTSPALIALPVDDHPLAFSPAVLKELLDKYDRDTLV